MLLIHVPFLSNKCVTKKLIKTKQTYIAKLSLIHLHIIYMYFTYVTLHNIVKRITGSNYLSYEKC